MTRPANSHANPPNENMTVQPDHPRVSDRAAMSRFLRTSEAGAPILDCRLGHSRSIGLMAPVQSIGSSATVSSMQSKSSTPGPRLGRAAPRLTPV